MSSPHAPRWAELLADAVTRPGRILEAYSFFHGYSLGNKFAALFQCRARGLSPGPIATLQRWNQLGRRVKPGEKAIVLCMPVTVRVRDEATTPSHGNAPMKTVFVWKARWFVLAQTDGEGEVHAPTIPAWDKATALEALGITEIPFESADGNVQGYAEHRTVAISPLAQLPSKTLFHELGHVLLGHTAGRGSNTVDLPKTLTEAEAEAVALLCLEALNLPGAEYARGYIQAWHGSGTPIPDSSAQRIFKAADQILRAGEMKESRQAAA